MHRLQKAWHKYNTCKTMFTHQSKVLCYGGVAIEAIIKLPHQPTPGITHIIVEEFYRLGGGAANVAQWLGHWGVPTRLSGVSIGYDHYGDMAWDVLNTFPTVDLQFLQRDHAVSTLVARSIPFPDGNTYLFCSDFAKAAMVPPSLAMLQEIQLLEVAFYYGNPRANAASAELAHLAHAQGIKIVAMDIVSTDHDTLPIADMIINSAASVIEQNPGVDPVEHSKALQSSNHGIVITTDGGRAINALDRDGTQYVLLPPSVEVTDSTGAGDSFRAGIIYGYLNGWALPRTLQWAAAVGAWQVRRSLSQGQLPSIASIADVASHIEVRKKT